MYLNSNTVALRWAGKKKIQKKEKKEGPLSEKEVQFNDPGNLYTCSMASFGSGVRDRDVAYTRLFLHGGREAGWVGWGVDLRT